jgi:hypothetical protein
MGILSRSRFSGLGLFALACAGALLAAPPARAQNCQVLRYTFQPDCFRGPTDTACAQSVTHLDLGPQIAIWIESADRTQFIATLMVTNMVAARGIGNRPGLWNFVSAPKFPYGKRQMALPIWAYTRGQLYDTVVMQVEQNEGWLGFNEAYSSPEPFFCRPLAPSDLPIVTPNPSKMIFCPSGWSSCLSPATASDDVQVDTVTCPTKFNSSKGKLDSSLPRQYYPPRNDLVRPNFMPISQDCDVTGQSLSTCAVDASGYAAADDLDAVAAATPPYGQVYSGIWNIPADLPAGDYAVWVEVNKEFDTNPSHAHPSLGDQHGGLTSYGLPNNFGQPSVVYRVPIRIDGPNAAVAAVSNIEGYSSWMGDSGTVIPRDSTISTADFGSGEARLLAIPGLAGMGRVQISLEQCGSMICDPPPPPPTAVAGLQAASQDVTATTAEVRFAQASANGAAVNGYEIRYAATDEITLTEDEFSQAAAAPLVTPGPPGTSGAVILNSLKPSTHYVVGVRSQGPCTGVSEIAFVDFTTPAMKFTQLSGCFIATAAYGSDMGREVAALRALRDQLLPRSALFAAAVDLYYRSGPAAAAVISRSQTARALARQLIAPLAGLAELAGQRAAQAPR